jgi:transcriptional regulator with XRE-family HTH domain
VTSVQQAREALGGKLRELRQATDINGRQLAERLSWPASKISKLETGRQTPSEADIRAWVNATTNEPQDAAALRAMLHTLETAHAEWQRLLRGGVHHHQGTWADMERKTNRLRVFEPAHVPGLLQTAGYARHRLAQAIAVFGTTNDIDAAVQARLARQDVLYAPRKHFHFVITEAVLRYRLCPPEVMLPQLDRLVAASTLPNVRLGVIDFGTAYVIAPGHGFWMFDDDRVLVEIFSAELTLAQPQEIELHTKVFGAMTSVASYGAAARAIITRVMEDLRATLPEGDDDSAPE